MKKAVIILLVITLVVFALAGCGGKSKDGGGGGGGGGGSASLETYDTGVFSAGVPKGWKAFPVSDIFDDYEGDYDPNGLNINKGAKSDFDVYSTPGIRIDYSKGGYTPEFAKGMYDDVVELDPVNIGSYTWIGCDCNVFGTHMIVLWSDDDYEIQVQITLEGGNKKISLDDADVQAIIASIALG